jgi:transposase InsO family protein
MRPVLRGMYGLGFLGLLGGALPTRCRYSALNHAHRHGKLIAMLSQKNTVSLHLIVEGLVAAREHTQLSTSASVELARGREPSHLLFSAVSVPLRRVVIYLPNLSFLMFGRGFLYLVAIMDRASCAVLSRGLSNTMDVSFCVSALEEALAHFGKPEIFNTDQGCPSWKLTRGYIGRGRRSAVFGLR